MRPNVIETKSIDDRRPNTFFGRCLYDFKLSKIISSDIFHCIMVCYSYGG